MGSRGAVHTVNLDPNQLEIHHILYEHDRIGTGNYRTPLTLGLSPPVVRIVAP